MSENSANSAALSAMLFEANKKSVGVTYLLWFFFGGLGGHRFYAGKTGSAVVMLILFVLGWMLIWVGIGIIFLIPLGIWALIDAFLIPGWIRSNNTKLAQTIVQ